MATVWTAGLTSTTTAPITGGLVKTDNDSLAGFALIPFVGTDPDAKVNVFSWDPTYVNPPAADGTALPAGNWTCGHVEANFANQQEPVHAGQYRPRGVKSEMKTREGCTSFDGVAYCGLVAKEGEASIPVSTFKETMRRHMITHGMWDVFNLTDPSSPNTNWDLFQKQARFPLDYVTRLIEGQRVNGAIADKYYFQNLDWSGVYIRNSISPKLLTQVLAEVPVTASGPETFVALMQVIYADGYDALDQCKEELKALSLKDFPGENISDLNLKITQYAERLDSAQAFEPDLLCKIVKVYETSTEPRFQQWAYGKYQECTKYVDALRVNDASVISLPLVTYKLLGTESNKQYRNMLASDRWSPALTKKPDSPTLPTAYQAMFQQAFAAALQQGGFSQRGGGGGAGKGGFSGDCHNCGLPGHMSRDCPQPKQSGGTGEHSGSTAWKFTRITDVLQKYGRTYKWCQKCADGKGQYMYHLTSGHDAWQARRDAESTGASDQGATSSTPKKVAFAQGNLATSGGTSDASAQGNMAASGSTTDDFIGFGGLLLPSKE